MKTYKIILAVLLFLNKITTVSAQEVNWVSLQENERHIVNVNGGLEHGVVFGAAYGYRFKTRMPLILNAEYSFPSGKKLLDDFKVKAGAQIRLYEIGNFKLSAKVQGIFRRYENSLVRMVNFGSYTSATAGYYRPKWFLACEFGVDKAIVTNFKHSGRYRDIFPGVQDGWYEPATGGNANYGLLAGYTIKRSDFYLKTGKLITQDFKTKPFLPFYFQLGYNFRL